MQTLMIFWSSWRLEMIVSERQQPAAKNVWTSVHSEFVMGKPILSELDLATAGVNTKGLHKHYMTHANSDDTSIVGHYKAEDLHSGPGYFSVSWSNLYDVFNLDALDISLIRCLTLWVYIAQKIINCHS